MIKIGEIKIENPDYPEKLKKIDTPPKILRYKGDVTGNVLKNTLAVVGSRRLTSYGKKATQKLVQEFASRGITIVSGFMYGVDATAHESALAVNGKTIAVLPCGVNIVHPAYQKNLYQQIIKKGVIFSEFENDFPPDRWTYPKRNRIVVGLSKAVLVIEAEENSGSLISANMAIKYNRKLFALPGSIFNSTSKGTNRLIKEGATLVTCADDILSFFGKENLKENKKESEKLSKDESLIIEMLEKEPLESDEIVQKLNISVSEINTLLSMLEIKGFLSKKGRKYYLN